MILIVSHFSKNRGTVHYYRRYLIKKKIQHLYLKHPFKHAEHAYSELILFNKEEEITLHRFRVSRHSIMDLIRNFLVSFFISIKFGRDINKVISYGSFNALPFLFFKKMYRRKVIFWALDYTTRRFSSFLLNKLYFLFETLSCRHCDNIVNPNIAQERIRVKNHKLIKNKSIIVPNGVERNNLNKSFGTYNDVAYVYIGSVTIEHGILDFIKYFYVERVTKNKLFIFGDGKCREQLIQIIERHKLLNVIYFGQKTNSEISGFFQESNFKFFGIAPYRSNESDLEEYRNSLKVKEYLNFGIPFIVPRVIKIEDDIKKYGITYSKLNEIRKEVNDFDYNSEILRNAISLYYWENIFKSLKI